MEAVCQPPAISARIGTPRASARSRSSSSRAAAPSPMTKPSRPASKGRLAVAGSGLRVSTRAAEHDAASIRSSVEEHPATAARSCPRRIRFAAWRTATAPLAQAADRAKWAPRSPICWATSAEAPFGRPCTIAKASTPRGPSRSSARAVLPTLASATSTPATTPISDATGGCSRAPSRRAARAAARSITALGSAIRATRGSTWSSGSYPRTWAATEQASPSASKRRSSVTPERPARRASQNSATELPSGETTPSPVTTTRRPLTSGPRSAASIAAPPGTRSRGSPRAPRRRTPRASGARRSPPGADRRPSTVCRRAGTSGSRSR